MTFVRKPYLKTTKIGYWFIALNMQERGELFLEDKNSSNIKVLIYNVHKTFLKVIRRKAKLVRDLMLKKMLIHSLRITNANPVS